MNAATKRIEAVPVPDARKAEPQVETVQPSEAGPPPQPAKPKKRRNRLLMLAVPLLLALGGGYVWLTGGRYVSTDNAYVHQPIVTISPDLAGRIVAVDVTENQAVAAGTPIFHLDPEPYRIALDKADAALASARLSVAQLRAAYATAQAKLTAAEQILDVRKREFDRQKALAGRGVSSSAALDEATMAVQVAENDVTLARQGVAAAAAALGGDPDIETDSFPAVRAALAQREAAERDLSKVEVVAPVAGIVSQIESLNVGQYVTPGTNVASIVETGETWIEANLKETQLESLQVGQPTSIHIDAYPGVELTGSVESIGSATGSQFSLIPAQNATGNWVKVVQRVPVRISVTPDADHPLRDGMSVTVSVDTGRTRLDKLG
ncbi:HlyD family secretion protein [Frigidibacter sp. ROC022]|uniref:HlyD family secretion protein n=1 Tax=Frigidibacter sp. ROC022 TaxID=2971796 RepID=UPI00215ADB79|nr:HlyD family secretion protein [Frigidibacter sp. ROC022]MCR8726032.1 HlyD family secretion protein [Frigidibacter sp. ROC022]